jgi:hypothetical protein
VSELQTVKFWLIGNVGLAKDALHIYVGLILFLGSALLFRWPIRSWKPFAVVLAAALAGEVWDIRDTLSEGRTVHGWSNWHDVWNTCFWPLAILLLARFSSLFDRR